MHHVASNHAAWLILLLTAVALTGCGESRDDSAPSPSVDGAWVKATRKGAAKVAGADTAAQQNWDGWCTLKGRIVVTNAPQMVDKLGVADQDPYCKQFRSSGALKTEDLLVDADGGLANVAVYLTTRGNVPVHESYAADAKKVVELDNRQCRFEPRICLMRTSWQLVIKNSDGTPHNTKFNSSIGQQFSEVIAANGRTAEKRLTREERRPTNYNCDFHKWMSGFLVLRNNPYMAKTEADGRFEIKYLPGGGTLELELWHERASALTGDVKEVNGATKLTVDKRGRLTVVLPNQGEASFELHVPGSVLGGS